MIIGTRALQLMERAIEGKSPSDDEKRHDITKANSLDSEQVHKNTRAIRKMFNIIRLNQGQYTIPNMYRQYWKEKMEQQTITRRPKTEKLWIEENQVCPMKKCNIREKMHDANMTQWQTSTRTYATGIA